MSRGKKAPSLKDGFYITIKYLGESGPGIRIHRDTKSEIDGAIEQYEKTRQVTYLGEVKDGYYVQ